MNRRQFTFPLLLICGIGLWLTSRWWLPWLFSFVPNFKSDENANLIQSIEALIGIVVFVIGGAAAYFKWIAPQPTAREPDPAVIVPISPAEIKARLTDRGGMKWVDRHATRFGDLRIQPRLALTGISRVGKTREAAELIERALAAGLIHERAIFQPGDGLRILQPETVHSAALKLIDRTAPTLLFVDDLPYHFAGKALVGLSELLRTLKECKEHFVLVTARSRSTASRTPRVAGKRGVLPTGVARPTNGADQRVGQKRRQSFADRVEARGGKSL